MKVIIVTFSFIHSLGCKVGYGYLHRIPSPAVQHSKQQNLSDDTTSSQALDPQVLAEKPVTVPAPPTSSVVDLPTTFHEEVHSSGIGLHSGAIIPNLANDVASIDLPTNSIVHLAADAPAILQFCDSHPSLQPPQSNVLHYPCLAPESSALPELQSIHDHPTTKIPSTSEGCTMPILNVVGIVASSNNSDIPGLETNIDNQEVVITLDEQGRCEKTEEKVNELLKEEETNVQKIMKSYEEDMTDNCVCSSEVESKPGEREQRENIVAVELLQEEQFESNCKGKIAEKALEEEQQHQMDDALTVNEGERLFLECTTKSQENEEIQLQVQDVVVEGQSFDGNTDELENQEPKKYLSREKSGNNFVEEETKLSKELVSGKLEMTDNRSEEGDLDKAADYQEVERKLEKLKAEQHFEEEEKNIILKDQQSNVLGEETFGDEDVMPRAEDQVREMLEDLQMKGNSVEQEGVSKEF
uniref:Uncharacterized protein n=1 Tax=Eptatretus burgeri TaxID=7764 RepID=A0A8C4QCP7_EPTBU